MTHLCKLDMGHVPNLSKFARLAWTITRSRPTNSNAPSNISSNANNHATTQLTNSIHNRGGSMGALRKSRSPLSSPSAYPQNGYFSGGNFYGGGRFTENLPEYRHEPPKTPPHILLHYSTFKVINSQINFGTINGI